ncbi:hypothetical protein [Microvirga splendida]|uniref:Uncharacterized protein n=1 Tax=Microvirga splendida TaxID=2795727 RepID=A0ABS0XZD9_9HYPH|nr:hypothetical protein [Microvirga splendida]MBJ6125424.1 hypothetical protein [Microvirga splendida]
MIKASKSGVLDFYHLDQEIARLEALLDDLHQLRRGRHPSAEELAAAPSIDQWSLTTRFVPCLVGLIQGHPSIPQLKLSVTSDLEVINTARGYARTRSRLYALGLRRGETAPEDVQ